MTPLKIRRSSFRSGPGWSVGKCGSIFAHCSSLNQNRLALRAFLKQNGIRTVIPGKSNRKKRIRHDKEAYKGRNVIERCFCRLKDWRRIATRYDKLARNYFSALCFVAMLAYWL
jgi:DDE family transposase